MFLLLATRKGIVKKTPLFEYANLRSVGLKAINLAEDDELIGACLTDGSRQIVLATHKGMSIRFDENDIRSMHRVSTGVMGIRLKKDDYAVDLDLVEEEKRCWPSPRRATASARALTPTGCKAAAAWACVPLPFRRKPASWWR